MARSQGICGVELGKDSLCVVHYQPQEECVTSVALQPVGDSPLSWWEAVRAEFKPVVREMRSEGRNLRGQRAVCSLPAEHATVTRLLIDSGEEDVAGALRWELANNLVGGLDEFAFDFQKLASAKPGPVEPYLAAAFRATWVSRVRELMRAHQLVPLVVDLDIFALINAFEVNYRDQLTAPALLVLGGVGYTKVVLTWNGQLVDYEFFKFGVDSDDPAAYAAALRASMDRLVSAHATLAGRGPVNGFAAGPAFAWKEFASECCKLLGTLQPLNPFRTVKFSAPPDSPLRGYAPRLAVAVGLAVRESAEPQP
jgi:Tfp pilus assembly PilM family ATPase